MPFVPSPPSASVRRELAPRAGLCADCRHLQVVRSKTSTFVRCGLSDADPRYPRYPPLPVHRCTGHRAAEFETPSLIDPATPDPAP